MRIIFCLINLTNWWNSSKYVKYIFIKKLAFKLIVSSEILECKSEKDSSCSMLESVFWEGEKLCRKNIEYPPSKWIRILETKIFKSLTR